MQSKAATVHKASPCMYIPSCMTGAEASFIIFIFPFSMTCQNFKSILLSTTVMSKERDHGIHYTGTCCLLLIYLASVTFGIMSIMKTSSGIVASYRQFMLGVNVIFKHRPRKLLCNLSRINYSKVYKPV